MSWIKIQSNKGKIYYQNPDLIKPNEWQYYEKIGENLYRKKTRSYDKEYRKQKRHEEYIKNREKELTQRKKWKAEHKEECRIKQREWTKKWKERNKEKYKIQQIAYYKLRKQLLLNAKCLECGTTEDLQLHHKEYNNNPDSIIVLCRICHKKLHRTYK